MHKVEADFRIFGFEESIDDINRKIGIQPTRYHMKGEIISPKSGKLYKENVWILDAPFRINVTDVEDCFMDIVQKLRPSINEVKAICEKYYSEFSCRIFLESNSEYSVPSLHFQKSFIEILGLLNSELDIDVYG